MIIISLRDLQFRLDTGDGSMFSLLKEACSKEFVGSNGTFLLEPYLALHHFSHAYWKGFPLASSSVDLGALAVELSASSIPFMKVT